MKLKNIFLIMSISLLVALLIWILIIFPNLQQFSEKELRNYINTGPDRAYYGGNYTEGIQTIQVRDSLVSKEGKYWIINSNSIGADKNTGQIYWNASSLYVINPLSRKNIAGIRLGADRSGYFLFPTNVEKKDYEFSSPEVLEKQAIVRFETESNFRGLRIYNFSYHLEDLDKTAYFPLLSEGEKIIGNHRGNMFVEPKSGVIVYFEHSGINKLYASNGSYLLDYEIWQNSFTDNTIANQINLALSLNNKAFIYDSITWIFIVAIILLLIFYLVAFFNKE